MRYPGLDDLKRAIETFEKMADLLVQNGTVLMANPPETGDFRWEEIHGADLRVELRTDGIGKNETLLVDLSLLFGVSQCVILSYDARLDAFTISDVAEGESVEGTYGYDQLLNKLQIEKGLTRALNWSQVEAAIKAIVDFIPMPARPS